MAAKHTTRRDARGDRRRGGYEVIVRGADGRARFKQVRNASAYRELLRGTKPSSENAISIDELARLLDT
jgi:hypothetical protein